MQAARVLATAPLIASIRSRSSCSLCFSRDGGWRRPPESRAPWDLPKADRLLNGRPLSSSLQRFLSPCLWILGSASR